ncbi:hypothetical protein D3C78_1442250 [compost metagenome]
MSLDFPGRVIRGQLMSLHLPAGFKRRSRRHTLETIAMIRAYTLEIIVQMSSYRYMPALRMDEAMNEPAFQIDTDSDSRSNGVIQTAVQALCGPPSRFPQGSRVNISIPS